MELKLPREIAQTDAHVASNFARRQVEILFAHLAAWPNASSRTERPGRTLNI
jgi:hypothetical protein